MLSAAPLLFTGERKSKKHSMRARATINPQIRLKEEKFDEATFPA